MQLDVGRGRVERLVGGREEGRQDDVDLPLMALVTSLAALESGQR